MNAAEHLSNYFSTSLPQISKFMINAGIAALVFFIGCKVINSLTKFFTGRLQKRGADIGTTAYLASFVRVIGKILLAVVLLGQLGVKDATIVAALGSVGVGLGLALQGGMANFAGGLIILLLKPFAVGDYIIEVSEKNEGTVKKIDMFYTTLRTVDNRKIVIPNKQLTDASVINVTATGKRMLAVNIGISYTDDIDKARNILEEICKNDPKVIQDRNINIHVDELADSSVKLGVQVWTDTDNYFPLKWSLNESIKKAFDQAGISIPYSQMDVHLFENGKRSAVKGYEE